MSSRSICQSSGAIAGPSSQPADNDQMVDRLSTPPLRVKDEPTSEQRVESMLASVLASPASPIASRHPFTSLGVAASVTVKRELDDVDGFDGRLGPGGLTSGDALPPAHPGAESSGSARKRIKRATKKVEMELKTRVKVEQQEEVESGPSGSGSASIDVKPAVQQGESSNAKAQADVKPDLEVGAKGKGRVKGEGKQKEVIATEPKRMFRWKKKCPQSTLQRLDRVLHQRMFLLDRTGREWGLHDETFKILGSTGNVYTVNIGALPNCDCPDASKGNIPCKHIIFVFIKVLKLEPSSELWYQKFLTVAELDTIFATAPPVVQGAYEVPARARAAWLKVSGQEHLIPESDREPASAEEGKGKNKDQGSKNRKDPIGEDCPVCFEEMEQSDIDKNLLIWDEGLYGCGKALHTECWKNWANSVVMREGPSAEVKCVWCRSTWPNATGAPAPAQSGAGYTAGGYLNIADLVGVSRKRDTSSYYWGPMRGRRMHDPRYEDD